MQFHTIQSNFTMIGKAVLEMWLYLIYIQEKSIIECKFHKKKNGFNLHIQNFLYTKKCVKCKFTCYWRGFQSR